MQAKKQNEDHAPLHYAGLLRQRAAEASTGTGSQLAQTLRVQLRSCPRDWLDEFISDSVGGLEALQEFIVAHIDDASYVVQLPLEAFGAS